MDTYLRALAAAALGVAVLLLLTYAVGRRVGKHSVIDVTWGLLFVAIAWCAFLTTGGWWDAPSQTSEGRRLLLVGLTTIWGLRLAVHIGRRSRGKPEDPRYEKLLKDRGPWFAAIVVYGLQGTLALVIGQVLLVGLTSSGDAGWLAALGAVVFAVGLGFETVGDAQLEAYKADPDRGPIMDRGLWRYTRHPNYFGDACVWTGLFLITVEQSPGWATVVSWGVMVYLLAFGSGKRVLERHMAGRPGFAEYQARTSGFFPLPPRS